MPKRPLMTPVSRAATRKTYAGNASSLRFAEVTCIIRHQAQFIDSLRITAQVTNYSIIGAWFCWLYCKYLAVLLSLRFSFLVPNARCERHGDRDLGHGDQPVYNSTRLYVKNSLKKQNNIGLSSHQFVNSKSFPSLELGFN